MVYVIVKLDGRRVYAVCKNMEAVNKQIMKFSFKDAVIIDTLGLIVQKNGKVAFKRVTTIGTEKQ
jgi:hypothetical protein